MTDEIDLALLKIAMMWFYPLRIHYVKNKKDYKTSAVPASGDLQKLNAGKISVSYKY